MMVHTKTFSQGGHENAVHRKREKEIERVRKVFEKHIQQMTAYDLVWSDKVGYVWLKIGATRYIDTGNWIEPLLAFVMSA